MSFLSRSGALVALVLAAVVMVGCGETVIDNSKTEAAIKQNLQRTLHTKISSVSCPSDVKVETGATFKCSVGLAGGKEDEATLKILNKEADVELTDLSPKG